MRAWCQALAGAAAALAIGVLAAAAQTGGVAPGGGADAMPEFEQAREPLRYAQAYQALCEDLRANTRNNVVLSSLMGKDDDAFRTAIGLDRRFVPAQLNFSAGQKQCTSPRKLDQRYLDFIRNMPAIRTDVTARIVRLDCVDLGGPLTILNLDAGALQLKSVTAQRVFVAFSKLPGGVKIEDTKLAEGFAIYASSVSSPITIAQSEIGNNANWQLALGLVSSNVDAVTIEGTKIGGKLDLSGLVATADVVIRNGTRVDQRLYGRGAKIGGGLTIKESAVGGVVTLDYTSIGRLEIDKGTFEAEVYLDHALVEKQLLIKNETKFAASLYATYIRTNEFQVQKAVFGKAVVLSSANIGALRITDAVTTPNCQDCDMYLGNANVHNLVLRNVRGVSVLSGNARYRTFDARGGHIRGFDCTDCQVDQYMLIGGKMSGLTDLAGADIKGTLIFSDGSARACWTPGAALNISELRADAIAAYAQDLMIDADPEAADCTKGTGTFVNTRLTGARYRALTPGRFDKTKLDRRDPHARPLVALGSEQLRALIKSSAEATAGRVPGQRDGYDPQPYEELAQALDRAGESEKAVDLRVAKIDARLETETNPLIIGWYWLYKKISRYGFENARAVVIFLALLAIGAATYVSARAKETSELWARRRFGTLLGLVLYGVWFSLDRAIPPLHLDPHMHDSSGLSWRARNYFYCHRVIGTLLISVAAAGAAGLGH